MSTTETIRIRLQAVTEGNVDEAHASVLASMPGRIPAGAVAVGAAYYDDTEGTGAFACQDYRISREGDLENDVHACEAAAAKADDDVTSAHNAALAATDPDDYLRLTSATYPLRVAAREATARLVAAREALRAHRAHRWIEHVARAETPPHA